MRKLTRVDLENDLKLKNYKSTALSLFAYFFYNWNTAMSKGNHEPFETSFFLGNFQVSRSRLTDQRYFYNTDFE